MTTTTPYGRLGNQIIRNLAVSLLAEKNNLLVDYCSHKEILDLGITLFSGTQKFTTTIALTDENYFTLYNKQITSNVDPNRHFFQTKEIIDLLYNHLQIMKSQIIQKNPFKERYHENNDVFVHIRLTDVAHFNPGLDYYLKAISKISFGKLYISSDDIDHFIVKQIALKYHTKIIKYNEIKTIQFASTCKHIILSHGSFSAIIGYLAFFSTIYYPKYEKDKMWYGDMFSISDWNML